MKRTISTSIGGIVFNVEEDAHAKLSAYLDAISASIKNSEGHDEIMADIESRIAEILQQKMGSFKQVVTLAEIDEVVSVMGKPEDFGAPGDTKQQSYSSGSRYSSWGSRRRMYRDTDDKVIFGVCSGLSHHFGIDPIWLRLAFGLSIFLGGFGIILYLLLTAIMPKARTTAEKLEMMGEPVDINNIRRSIEEEMEHFKKKVKDFGNDFRDSRPGDHAKEFGRDLGDFFSSAGRGLGSLIGGVVKAILAFVGIIIAFLLALSLIAVIFSLTSGVNLHLQSANGHNMHYSLHTFWDMLSVTGSMRAVLITGILFFLGIPLIALIVRFGRAAAGRKRPFQWFTITASILWAASWILLMIGIISISSHFSVSDSIHNDVKINTQAAKTLYVKMNNNEIGDDVIQLDSLNTYLSDENELMQNPTLCIKQSPDSNYHLVLTKIARGVTRAEADEFADYVDYTYSVHDSTLTLDPYYTLDINKGWRKQQLDLTIEVPLDRSVALPQGIDHVICYKLRHEHKGQHFGGQTWNMTSAGLVQYGK